MTNLQKQEEINQEEKQDHAQLLLRELCWEESLRIKSLSDREIAGIIEEYIAQNKLTENDFSQMLSELKKEEELDPKTLELFGIWSKLWRILLATVLPLRSAMDLEFEYIRHSKAGLHARIALRNILESKINTY